VLDIVWIFFGYYLVLFGYYLYIVLYCLDIHINKTISFCCVADSVMVCVFSSVDLDYVFDYCYAFTALGRARRERMTHYYIFCVFV